VLARCSACSRPPPHVAQYPPSHGDGSCRSPHELSPSSSAAATPAQRLGSAGRAARRSCPPASLARCRRRAPTPPPRSRSCSRRAACLADPRGAARGRRRARGRSRAQAWPAGAQRTACLARRCRTRRAASRWRERTPPPACCTDCSARGTRGRVRSARRFHDSIRPCALRVAVRAGWLGQPTLHTPGRRWTRPTAGLRNGIARS